jgi:hypothetical protein
MMAKMKVQIGALVSWMDARLEGMDCSEATEAYLGKLETGQEPKGNLK